MAAKARRRFDQAAGFLDRQQAGMRLGQRLRRYAGAATLVLGIPRGGVPVAAEVARALDAELDVVVAHKVGAPFQPELAIGAVTANGGQYVNETMVAELGVSKGYLDGAFAREMAQARRREEQFRRGRPPLLVANRTVIVVDDGLATGATMRAALRSVRSRGPGRLVAAAPVGARETCLEMRAEADEVICLLSPEPFWAVGFFYQRFEPVEDSEVTRLLDAAAVSASAAIPVPPGAASEV
jgi:putative phosphoribosyl transferase